MNSFIGENRPTDCEFTGRKLRSKEELEQELADAKLLQRISTELIRENGTNGLYKKIVEAAAAIMGSQYASMQMLVADNNGGKLHMLASSGFTAEAEKFWEWVYHHTGSSCGQALRTKQRAIIPNFATCEFMKDAPTLPIFLEGGILAAQSTPLYSRDGRLLGMISTHWSFPHTPSERELSSLDLLARQAADLIDRNQANEALRQSEERLRALATATNDVIYRMSADWSQMYHLDGRDFLIDTGTPIDDWMHKYIHPEDFASVAEVIQEAISLKRVFQLEHRVLKADGNYGWTFSRAIPILDNNGDIIEWFGAASDISEKRSTLIILENKVEERTRELQQSNENLQKFAHVASHDLKEPVRKIKTYALRLKDEFGNASSEHILKYTDKVLESADRMSTMIEGVLTYSSLNALEQETGIVDLNKVMADIALDLEVQIQQRNAEFKYAALPSVKGIEVLIYQVFNNIVNNSLKFSKITEKAVITIESAIVQVNGVNCAQLKVTDNGIGFDSKHRETIFKTFARLNSKGEYDGTGLGLSLAKNIVERHNGTIEADGSKGVGAVITVTLPLA